MSILKSPIKKCLESLSLATKYLPQGLCYLCQQPSAASVCPTCEQDCLFFNCAKAGHNLLNWPAIKQGLTPGKYQQLVALSYFQWPLDHLVRRFKYGHPKLASILVPWFLRYTQVTSQPLPDCLLPVPVSPWRYGQRQYHQTLLLAHALGKALNIEVSANWARRRGWQASQQSLGRQARLRNLKQAYQLNQAPLPRRVAIIDDVVTTGATIATLSKMLHKASPETEIVVWAMAITPVKPDPHILQAGYQFNLP
ncbi:ComF family protein [Alteromonas lipolytica]|uniref:Phosphoribosyltransferase domain-containing protein n=1 Tax=Alteromonas lipolytica TaxID=1856405 RepID=A0A1E8FAW6_9ALTE|nr:ComF family protein [Alteromonas lipolytica]OFI33049.1 hypothetical protein BFC17_01895 [Alteromonas lipolytica]GGF63000.1 amidophosphoribosyltransferase [Alteromonas lipolytica]